jgi:pilus assembly protein Flp/PilA
MEQVLHQLIADESGQDLIEYALMAALVGLGTISAMNSLSSSIYNFYIGISTALGQAPTA